MFVWERLSLSLLKDNFSGYKILGWWLFSFNVSSILLYLLLACMVSEKLDLILIFALLKVRCVFFFPFGFFQDILSLVFYSLNAICLDIVIFCIYPTLCSLSFLDCWFGISLFFFLTLAHVLINQYTITCLLVCWNSRSDNICHNNVCQNDWP